MQKLRMLIAFALATAWLSPASSAELAELNIAQQYGIGYLSLMVMEEQKLIEKHAKAAGVDVKVNWAKFAGGNVMNDALLSGSLQIASGGVGSLADVEALMAAKQPNIEGVVVGRALYDGRIDPAAALATASGG